MDAESGFHASRDISPLTTAQLSDEEVETIVSIERRLYEVSTVPHVPMSREDRHGYAERAGESYGRVMLLDGSRGTGKTSIFKTLAKRWLASAEARATGTGYSDALLPRVKDLEERSGRALQYDGPPSNVVVLKTLEFDALPPEMPLLAGAVQAWRAVAGSYDALSAKTTDTCDFDETRTLMDIWHGLFRVAAVGWTPIPKHSGLIEQVLDREEQVEDWQRFDARWLEFVDEVISRGKCLSGKHRLAKQPIFVVMIDDVDLQVGRVRELLPALRLLYHARVVFLVAADRWHMVDMLKLDFLGQQNRIALHQGPSNALDSANLDAWAGKLARAAFQKAFPIRNRWNLTQLNLLSLLEFPDGKRNIRCLLNVWSHRSPGPVPATGAAGEYLQELASQAEGVTDLTHLMTYRTAHQFFMKHEFLLSKPNASPEDANDAMREFLSGTDGEALVRVTKRHGQQSAIDYRVRGELIALYHPDLSEAVSGQADITLSARPEFAYRAELSQIHVTMAEAPEALFNFTSALLAVSLREDGYGVDAPGLIWNVRLAIAWTRVRIFDREHEDPNLDLSFQWRFHEHPSPKRLLDLTRTWADFLEKLPTTTEERLDRIAYAWIYHHLKWLEVALDDVPCPFDDSFNTTGWPLLLKCDPGRGTPEERQRWKTRTLPLLARPEIGLSTNVQKLLLDHVINADADTAFWLYDQRRRLVTDAIIAAADEAALPPKDPEDRDRVARAIEVFERRHRDIYKKDSLWQQHIESRFPK
jgi:hypothetical protein